jgi:hypothetical protein
MGNISQTSVGTVLNHISQVQANRLNRSCNDAGLSARAQTFCVLLDEEFNDQEKQSGR